MKFFFIFSRVRAHARKSAKCIAHTRARNNSIFIFRTKYPSPHAHQAIVLISILLSQKFPLFVNLSKNDKFLLFISKTRFTFAYR